MTDASLQNWSQLVYLSGIIFEVSLEKDIFTQKPQQMTQHIDKRGKKRATYIPCKLQLVGSFTEHVSR